MPFGFGRGIDFFLFNNVSAPRKNRLFHTVEGYKVFDSLAALAKHVVVEFNRNHVFHHTHLYSIWWFRYGFAYSTTALVTLEKIVVVEFIGATPATTCFT